MTGWSHHHVRRMHPHVAALGTLLQTHDCYIAGGYARWACSPRVNPAPYNDIDIVCPSQRHCDGLFAAFKVSGFKYLREGQFSYTFEAPKVISGEIQLLKGFWGNNVKECIDQFDLSVCRIALIGHDVGIADAQWEGDESALKCRVSCVVADKAENSVCRLLRYAHKGYTIDKASVDTLLNVIKTSAAKAGPAAIKPEPPKPEVSAFSFGS